MGVQFVEYIIQELRLWSTLYRSLVYGIHYIGTQFMEYIIQEPSLWSTLYWSLFNGVNYIGAQFIEYIIQELILWSTVKKSLAYRSILYNSTVFRNSICVYRSLVYGVNFV